MFSRYKMASASAGEATFCDKSKQLQLLEAVFLQFQQNLFCDVIIKVACKEFYVHANILAAASPYFSTFLLQDVPRSFCQKTPQIIEIQVDSEAQETLYQDAVESILRFIYTGVLTVTERNLSQTHEVARIMQLDDVEAFCYNYIQGKIQSASVYNKSAEFPQSRHSGTNTDLSVLKGLLDGSETVIPDKPCGFMTQRMKSSRLTSVGCQTVSVLNDSSTQDKLLIHQSTSTESQYLQDFIKKLTEKGGSSSGGYNSKDQNIFVKFEEDEDFSEEENVLKQQSTRSGRQVKIKSFDFPSGVSALENDKKHTIQISVRTVGKNTNETGTGMVKQEDCEKQDEIDQTTTVMDDLPCENENSINNDINNEKSEAENVVNSDGEQNEELLPVISSLDDIIKKTKSGSGHKKGHSSKAQTKIEYAGRSSKEYSCSECTFMTTKVREMTAHTLSHKYEQLICFYCDVQFDETATLDTHMCSHTGPTPFLCTTCSTPFKTRTLLNLHLPKHLDEKPYVCEVKHN